MRDLSTEKGLVKNVRVQVVSNARGTPTATKPVSIYIHMEEKKNRSHQHFISSIASYLIDSDLNVPTADGAALTIPSPIGLWNDFQQLSRIDSTSRSTGSHYASIRIYIWAVVSITSLSRVRSRIETKISYFPLFLINSRTTSRQDQFQHPSTNRL
jgi:hypothetical protein